MAEFEIEFEESVRPPATVRLTLSEDEFKTLACLHYCHHGMHHPTRRTLEQAFAGIRGRLGYTVSHMRSEREERIG